MIDHAHIRVACGIEPPAIETNPLPHIVRRALNIPCPFCGGIDLRRDDWVDDEGDDIDAIECRTCLGSAPAAVWVMRSGAHAPLPASVVEALNSGDGSYRP